MFSNNNPMRFVDPDGMNAGDEAANALARRVEDAQFADQATGTLGLAGQFGADQDGGDPPTKGKRAEQGSVTSTKEDGVEDRSARYGLEGMNDPLYATKATLGLFELVGIGTTIQAAGSLYRALVGGLAGGLKWTLTKAGYQFAAKEVSQVGEVLGDFGIPKYYTYTSSGNSIFISPHAMKHLEELSSNAAKIGPNYMKLLGQLHQKALHSAIDDVLSRVAIQFDKPYFSGGNKIIFGAPRSAGELPAVKHFSYQN